LFWYPKVERFQLFDLSADPDELNDLAAKPEHAEKLAAMKTLLAAEQKAWGDSLAPAK
jgi:hypothetical protein